VGRQELIDLGEQEGLLLRACGPLRGVPVEQDEVRLRVLRHEVDSGVDRCLDLRRRGHRRGVGSADVEGFVDLRGVGGPAVPLEVSSVAVQLERDLAVPIDVDTARGHPDTGVREPDGLSDLGAPVEEARRDRDVLLPGGHGRGVPDLQGAGELLALLHDRPQGDRDGMGSRKAVHGPVRDDDLVPIRGDGDGLDDLPVALAQGDP